MTYQPLSLFEYCVGKILLRFHRYNFSVIYQRHHLQAYILALSLFHLCNFCYIFLSLCTWGIILAMSIRKDILWSGVIYILISWDFLLWSLFAVKRRFCDEGNEIHLSVHIKTNIWNTGRHYPISGQWWDSYLTMITSLEMNLYLLGNFQVQLENYWLLPN